LSSSCAAAGLGLLPGALSTGIGVQLRQPLARVVVGGMITSSMEILFLLPLLASFLSQAKIRSDGKI
jgi:cobalt-zinc-cadmium resistance protein CzcA